MPRQINSVHALRGIAALLVVLFHWRDVVDEVHPGLGTYLFGSGYAGVDLFFIISGFVMVIATCMRSDDAATAFVIRRFFRVIPLATLGTLAMLLLTVSTSTSDLITSLLFLPRDHSASPPSFGYALNVPQWTIGYELLFYGIFAIALRISHRYRTLVASAIILVLIVSLQLLLTGVLTARAWEGPRAGFEPTGIGAMLANPLCLEFIVGMMIAELFLSKRWALGKEFWRIAFLLALVMTIAAMLAGPKYSNGLVGWGPIAALIFMSAVFLERQGGWTKIAWLTSRLGDWSYAMYVAHLPVTVFVASYFNDTQLYQASSGFSRALLFLAATLATSALLHQFVEIPFITIGKRVAAALRTPESSIRTPIEAITSNRRL